MVLAISYFYAEVIFVNDVAPYTFLNWVCHIFIMDILIESGMLSVGNFTFLDVIFYFETSMYNQNCCNSLIAYLTITRQFLVGREQNLNIYTDQILKPMYQNQMK